MMELKENHLNLTPITNNPLLIPKIEGNRIYIYISEKDCHIHLNGEELFKAFPVGSQVETIYMDPNHIFIIPSNNDKKEFKYTIAKVGTKPIERFHTCIHFNAFAKRFKLKSQDPTQNGANHSGVKKEGIPYKYNGISGWLVNIDELQPEI